MGQGLSRATKAKSAINRAAEATARAVPRKRQGKPLEQVTETMINNTKLGSVEAIGKVRSRDPSYWNSINDLNNQENSQKVEAYHAGQDAVSDEMPFIPDQTQAPKVPAGQWTVEPIDTSLIDELSSKDTDLVHRMNEMPEIVMSVPKESVGSRKIHKSLPQDRSKTTSFTEKEVDTELDGRLNTAQLRKMLTEFLETPHDTSTTR